MLVAAAMPCRLLKPRKGTETANNADTAEADFFSLQTPKTPEGD